MAAALNVLGQLEVDRGHYRQGIAALSEAVGIIKSLQGESRHSLPALYAYLAENQYYLFDFPAAEQNYRLSLATARSLKGEEHEDVIQTKYRLGSFLVLTSRPQEGLKVGPGGRELALRTKGPNEVFHTPMVREGYGNGLIRYGRVEEGLALISQTMDVRRRAKRVQTRDFASFLDETAIGETELGHDQQAKALLDEGFAIHTAVGDAAPSERLGEAIRARSRLLVATGHAQRGQYRSARNPQERGVSIALHRSTGSLAQSEVALAIGHADDAIRYASEMRRWLEPAACGLTSSVTKHRPHSTKARASYSPDGARSSALAPARCSVGLPSIRRRSKPAAGRFANCACNMSFQPGPPGRSSSAPDPSQSNPRNAQGSWRTIQETAARPIAAPVIAACEPFANPASPYAHSLPTPLQYPPRKAHQSSASPQSSPAARPLWPDRPEHRLRG